MEITSTDCMLPGVQVTAVLGYFSAFSSFRHRLQRGVQLQGILSIFQVIVTPCFNRPSLLSIQLPNGIVQQKKCHSTATVQQAVHDIIPYVGVMALTSDYQQSRIYIVVQQSRISIFILCSQLSQAFKNHVVSRDFIFKKSVCWISSVAVLPRKMKFLVSEFLCHFALLLKRKPCMCIIMSHIQTAQWVNRYPIQL